MAFFDRYCEDIDNFDLMSSVISELTQNIWKNWLVKLM